MALGQAAGEAAVLALETSRLPSKLSVRELQERLRARDAVV
jgi:hypothetical protein